jgi:predicted O-methyltransferase YrrM
VYSSFHLLKKYIHYYLTSLNAKGHGMHSPFVFDFIQNVLNNEKGYKAPVDIEKLRKELLTDNRIVGMYDPGAGSRLKNNVKLVSTIAKRALKPYKYASVLYRLIRHYKPSSIIELGTSLGITTAYLSKANNAANAVTIEGNREVAKIARENFLKLNCTNIQLINGDFDTMLPQVINEMPAIDFVFIDGNHRYKPTISYFHQFLSKSNKDTILVFDDIHWSKEMEKAWDVIKAHPEVMYTIDIFFLGFVFFRNEFKVKQDFKIQF